MCGQSAVKDFTRKELLAVIVVLFMLLLLVLGAILPGFIRKQKCIACVGRLMNIGLSSRIFATDNGGLYPYQALATNDAARAAATNIAWHFRLLSNELSTPRILVCPADSERKVAKGWESLSNSNISYFISLSATERTPEEFLAGDRNLTVEGVQIASGPYEIKTNLNLGWSAKMHKFQGSIAFGDGSVQQLSISRLKSLPRTHPNSILVP